MNPKKPKKTWAKESGVHDLDGMTINIYGPPGVGKTWAALTLSKKWPKDITERTHKSPKIQLDDIIHVSFDSSALAGLVAHNVTVKYAFNFAAMTAELGFERASEVLTGEVMDILEEDENVIGVIYDTITTADRYSLAHWESPENCATVIRGGAVVADTRRMFGLHLAWHRTFQTAASQVPGRVSLVNLFHEKYIDEIGATSAGAKSKKIGDMTITTIPATTGSAWQYYTTSASLELWLNCVSAKQAGKRVTTRKLYPYSHDGHRVKNRFAHTVIKPVEPDLQALLQLIKS